MSTATFSNFTVSIPGWRFLVGRHPEWWAMLVSGGTCLYLLAPLLTGSATGDAHRHHRTGGMDWSGFGHWALMIPAMMYPFLIGHLRVAATRSFWNRRNRAMALFLTGYSVPWFSFGILAVPISKAIDLPACLTIAALWQLTPWKRAGELACHRTIPLAPSGFRADLDCLRYGVTNAAGCWLACWGLMLACAASHTEAWAMPAITFLLWAERMPRPGMNSYSRFVRSAWVAAALTIAAVAAYLGEV